MMPYFSYTFKSLFFIDCLIKYISYRKTCKWIFEEKFKERCKNMDYEVLKVTIAEKIIYTWVMCFFLLYLQHSYPYEPPKKATYCSRTQWIWYSILKPFFILTLKVWTPKGHVSSYTAKCLVFWFFDNKRSKR